MRIAVAMNGGPGSSLVAAILRLSGHEILGITLKYQMPPHPEISFMNADAPDDTDIISAKRTARQYDFQHRTILIEEEQTKKIIDYVSGEYKNGRLPSPEIFSNSEVKFKRLIAFTVANRYEKVAAGYYARICRSGNGRYYPAVPLDRERDRSHFLCRINQDMLQYIILPLGDYHNDAMKRLLEQVKLNIPLEDEKNTNSSRAVGDEFSFSDESPFPPGQIIDTEGNPLGEHKGIHRYLVGQECGISRTDGKPLFVTKIDPGKNIIIAAEEEKLYCNGLIASGIVYMRETSLDGIDAIVKTGPHYKPFEAKLTEKKKNIHARFSEPRMPVIPGQAAVFYAKNGDMLGSGWIENKIS